MSTLHSALGANGLQGIRSDVTGGEGKTSVALAALSSEFGQLMSGHPAGEAEGSDTARSSFETGVPPATSTPTSSGAPTSSSGSPGEGGTDLENAMSSTQAKDPKLAAKLVTDEKSGKANNLAEDAAQAYKEGAMNKTQCEAAEKDAQSNADNGGGKFNKNTEKDVDSTLGEKNVVHGGETRAGHNVKKLAELTPIGALVKGVKDKTGKQPSENIVSAAKAPMQAGSQKAMQDMAADDPGLAQKYQADKSAGNANGMVDDMVAVKKKQDSGQDSKTFTSDDAAALGSEDGDSGKGKVGGKQTKAFDAAFGQGMLAQGSSKADKGFSKVEDTIGSVTQKAVAPAADTYAGIDKLSHGDKSGAENLFKQGVETGAENAAMVAAPEAAPEMMAGEAALRGGVDTASASKDASEGAGKAAGKINDAANNANDAANLFGGNGGDNSNGNVEA